MLQTNQIYLGDCLSVMQEIEDKSVNLILTSPPYDGIKDYNGSLKWNESIWKECIKLLQIKLKDGGVVVWVVGDETKNGSESGTSFKQALFFKEIGFNLWDTMIYEKSGISYPGSQKRYFNTFEYMFIFSLGEPKVANLLKDRPNKYVGTMGGNKRGGLCKREEFGRRFNIWRYNNGKFNSSKDKNAFLHPAVFPEKLAEDHIKTWTNEGDLVFDPMMGSGTTCLAAKNLNRQFIGIEKEEKYFNIAKERLNLC